MVLSLCTLWVRSTFVEESFHITFSHKISFRIKSETGHLSVEGHFDDVDDWYDSPLFRYVYDGHPYFSFREPNDLPFGLGKDRGLFSHYGGGFGYLQGRYNFSEYNVFVMFPMWAVGLPFVVYSIWHWHRRRRRPIGHCPTCGYDLTGNVSGTCPECGAGTGPTLRRGRRGDPGAVKR